VRCSVRVPASLLVWEWAHRFAPPALAGRPPRAEWVGLGGARRVARFQLQVQYGRGHRFRCLRFRCHRGARQRPELQVRRRARLFSFPRTSGTSITIVVSSPTYRTFCNHPLSQAQFSVSVGRAGNYSASHGRPQARTQFGPIASGRGNVLSRRCRGV
jgi:hypothetical protein